MRGASSRKYFVARGNELRRTRSAPNVEASQESQEVRTPRRSRSTRTRRAKRVAEGEGEGCRAGPAGLGSSGADPIGLRTLQRPRGLDRRRNEEQGRAPNRNPALKPAEVECSSPR